MTTPFIVMIKHQGLQFTHVHTEAQVMGSNPLKLESDSLCSNPVRDGTRVCVPRATLPFMVPSRKAPFKLLKIESSCYGSTLLRAAILDDLCRGGRLNPSLLRLEPRGPVEGRHPPFRRPHDTVEVTGPESSKPQVHINPP